MSTSGSDANTSFTSSVISAMISFAGSERVYVWDWVMSMNHIYLFARAVKMILKITTIAIKAMVNAVATEPYLNFLD